MFTNGYELTTAITNLIICAMSLYCLFKSKNKLKVWTVFYIVISIASFLGFIYHGIILNEEIKEYIWKVLTFMFCIGINSLLVVALNEVKKLTNKKSILSVFIMSFVLFVMFMLLEFNNIDSFGYYKGYCAVSMIGMLLFYIIRLVKNKKSYTKHKC